MSFVEFKLEIIILEEPQILLLTCWPLFLTINKSRQFLLKQIIKHATRMWQCSNYYQFYIMIIIRFCKLNYLHKIV
jgi:hypothetical protein